MRARSQRHLLRLLAVATLLHGSVCSGRAEEAPATEDPIRVVFYNLKNYLAMDRRVDGKFVLDAPKPDREIVPLIEGIVATAPDVLGVCEIGDPEYVKDLQNRLRERDLDYPYTELVRAKSGHDRNLALFSKFPFAETHSRDDYTYRIYDDRLAFQRGILDATIQVNPSYQLRLLLLHLKSKREVPEADQSKMRLNEAHLARKHLDAIFKEHPNVNLMVMGDLNDDRHEPPVKAVQGYYSGRGYLSPLSLTDEYGFRWTHYWGTADSYGRLDYALYSRGISREIDRKASHIHHWPEWYDASDHRPIVVIIEPQESK